MHVHGKTKNQNLTSIKRANKQQHMGAETYTYRKTRIEQRHIKQIKQRNKSQNVRIRVSGHEYAYAYFEYAYAYFEYACASSKLAYAYFEYACACVRIHALNPNPENKNKNKTETNSNNLTCIK